MADWAARTQFPLVDHYHGMRLDRQVSELRPGEIIVAESDRRLRREQSYGYIRALWWVWFADDRSLVSVPLGAGDGVQAVVRSVSTPDALFDPELAAKLKPPVDAALRKARLPETDRVIRDLMLACNPSLLRRHRHGQCQRLTDESIPPAEGLKLPRHCFPDGIVYAVTEDGKAVSIAFSHRTGFMEERIAHIGVATAPGYRRRGYAKTVVSAVVAHVARAGGEATYGCSPDNHASIVTARSVGFVPYASSLILSAPDPALRT